MLMAQVEMVAAISMVPCLHALMVQELAAVGMAKLVPPMASAVVKASAVMRLVAQADFKLPARVAAGLARADTAGLEVTPIAAWMTLTSPTDMITAATSKPVA